MGRKQFREAAILLIITILFWKDISAYSSPAKTLSGKHFVFCFPTNRGPPDRERTMNIQVYSTSSSITNISIAAPGISWYVQITLDPNQMESVEAPDEVEADRYNLEEQNGTIIITSDCDIYVTAVSYALDSFASFPIVPFESASGREFFIANFQPSPFYPSEIMLTASATEANVIVKTSAGKSFNDFLLPDNFKYFELNDNEMGFVLSSNQSVQLRYTSDVTGLQIFSDSPISVISGGECTYVLTEDYDCDHIAAYMPPVDRLGRQFTISPFAGRKSGYVYRIVAVRDDTNITIHAEENFKLDAGFYYTKDITDIDHVTTITSSKPVLVVQFAKGYTSDDKLGDPLMMVVPPEEQYVDSISFSSFDMNDFSISKNYLNLIIHCEYLNGVLFNGEEFNPDDWMDVLMAGSQCVIRRELVTSSVNHITHASNDARFVAFMYGVGNRLSYGYPLDRNFNQITCTVPDGINRTKDVDCDFEEVDIKCPDDMTQSTDAGMPTAVVTWPDVIANDTTGVLNVTSNYNSGDAFPIGITEVTYWVEDSDGEIRASCSFDVTVEDEEAPILTCPEDIRAYADGEPAIAVEWIPPTPTDNSGNVSWMNSSSSSGDVFYIGNTVVTYAAGDQAGNKATCSFDIIIIGRCPADTTEDEDLGLLNWPPTEVDLIAQSNQRCPIDTDKGGYGVATRLCLLNENGIAKWEPPEVQECGENREVDIGDLPETPVVEDNVQEVADALEDLTNGIEIIAPDDITDIADTLENIVNVEIPTEEVASSVVHTVGNLLEGETSSSSDAVNSSSSIIKSLEYQIEITLENEGSLRIIDPSIAVDGLTVNSAANDMGVSEIVGGLTFVVKNNGDNGNGDLTDERVQTYTNLDEVPKDIETTIELPESLFSPSEVIPGGQQVSFTVYQEDSLFISPPKKTQNLTVAGAIVSADVLGESNTNLQAPVVIRFLPYQIPDITDAIFNTSVCVFWDFELQNGAGDWSTSGCVLSRIENGLVVCQCSHLTNFAVLMDISGHDMTGTKALVLDVITYVGCALSILSLVITLTIFLGFRKLRTTRQRIILINFCFSLLFLYIVFISGVDTAVGSSVFCPIVAALIHYFTLTTMMWMGVEARNLYSKLVTVFEPEKDWFMIAASLIAWGSPLAIVGITVGVEFDDYASDDYCFIPPGPALHYGMLLPIGLILLHNFVIFILIMRSLLKSGMGGKDKMSALSARLQNAVTISILLGLTWVFGFLAIEGATFIFQLIFCICNSLQGVLILLLFCLRDEDVRKCLRPYIICSSSKLPEWRSNSSSDKASFNASQSVKSTTYSNQDSSLQLSETGK